MIDIIIPVLNEEKILREKRDYYLHLARHVKLTFVDGASEDNTVELAKQYGDVVISRRGRSYQKNVGAENTQNDFLMFVHVDSFITPETADRAIKALKKETKAGCFSMHIEDPKRIFRLYESIVNFRGRHFGIIDGDLGLFIHRAVFNELGGFDRLPIMDDIVFSKRLHRKYPVIQLDSRIRVSARKWHEKGFVTTFFQYTLAYVQLWTGIPFFKDHFQDTYETSQSVNHICT